MEAFMSPTQTPGADAPIKYTKDSFIGVRDAWLSFAAARLSKAAAALEQVADKLPAAVKSKLPLGKFDSSKTSNSSGASAPS
jgi:hypothetical protein